MLLVSYTLTTITRYEGKGRKVAASTTIAMSAEPKSKKIKVLTHRPRYIDQC
jgi:hypothetical protein